MNVFSDNQSLVVSCPVDKYNFQYFASPVYCVNPGQHRCDQCWSVESSTTVPHMIRDAELLRYDNLTGQVKTNLLLRLFLTSVKLLCISPLPQEHDST